MPVYSKETKTGTRWYVSMRAEGHKVYPPGSWASKTEAALALKRLQIAKADGKYRAPDGKTVDGFLTWWIDTHKGLRPRTAALYRSLVRLYVSPIIGKVPLQRVTAEDVQRVVDAAEANSVHTALKVRNILRTAFGRAVALGHIRRNPASAGSGFEAPRLDYSKAKVEAPPYAEVLRVVAASEGHPMYLPLAIAAYTGLRRGEVLALRWSDVDGRELHVRQSLSFVGRDLRFGEPKTSNARRSVPVPDELARILNKAKAEQDERRLGLGQDWRDLGLVIDNGDGSPVHPERLTRYFGRLVRRLGVAMREHDLRHAYISELLSRGVSPLAVSRIAGHAKAAFTMDRYGHVMPRDFDAVRAALSVEGARG